MRPIAISLSPNSESDDVRLALKKFLTPWNNDEKWIEALNESIIKYFGNDYLPLTYDSGRSAFYELLKSIGVNKSDEVIIQALTCNAVANPIMWTGAKVIYADVGQDMNIDPSKLESKITGKTKAVVVQHSFGIPADIRAIQKITKKNNILLIEDLALGFGGSCQDQKLGTYGDAAFLSFGRDKSISSVFGGALITKDKSLAVKLLKSYKYVKYPRKLWTYQQVFHPIAFFIILPVYNLGIGKITLGKLLLNLLQKLHLLSKPLDLKESKSVKPSRIPSRLSGKLAHMANYQFSKIDRFTDHRSKIVDMYKKELNNSNLTKPMFRGNPSWVRFPILVENRDSLFKYAKSKKILLGDWYKKIVVPSDNLEIFNYTGDCKVAEDYKDKIINLPTYPTMTIEDAKYVVALIKQWESIK